MTLVRSPTISGRLRLLGFHQFDAGIVGAMRRRLEPRAARWPSAICAMARMCAGVVPQQPPTMFSQPCSTNFSSCVASDSGVSRYLSSSFGRPALG